METRFGASSSTMTEIGLLGIGAEGGGGLLTSRRDLLGSRKRVRTPDTEEIRVKPAGP